MIFIPTHSKHFLLSFFVAVITNYSCVSIHIYIFNHFSFNYSYHKPLKINQLKHLSHIKTPKLIIKPRLPVQLTEEHNKNVSFKLWAQVHYFASRSNKCQKVCAAI